MFHGAGNSEEVGKEVEGSCLFYGLGSIFLHDIFELLLSCLFPSAWQRWSKEPFATSWLSLIQLLFPTFTQWCILVIIFQTQYVESRHHLVFSSVTTLANCLPSKFLPQHLSLLVFPINGWSSSLDFCRSIEPALNLAPTHQASQFFPLNICLGQPINSPFINNQHSLP